MSSPMPNPRRMLVRPLQTARQDTLSAIAHHLDQMTSRINRLSASQQRVMKAVQSKAPNGVSRLDWIARQLNEQ